MEPKELSKHLVTTNEQACKSQLRFVVVSYNGIAGLYILKNQYEEAIKSYKIVLALSKQFSDKITVDKLPIIHALHNMIYCYSVLEKQEDLSVYKEQMNSLIVKYLQEKSELVALSQKAYEETSLAIKTTYKEIGAKELKESVSASMEWIAKDSVIYVNKINAELAGNRAYEP